MFRMASVAVAVLLASSAPVTARGSESVGEPVLQRGTVKIGPSTVRQITARSRSVAGSSQVDVHIVIADGRGRRLQRIQHRSIYPLASPENRLCFEDYDFDGFLDLVTLADRGGKWHRYDIWHFDRVRGRFVRDELARSLSRLSNLAVEDEHGRLVTWSIGPAFPFERFYRVQGQRLVLDEACAFRHHDPGDYLQGTIEWVRRGRRTRRTPYVAKDLYDLPCRRHSSSRSPATCLGLVSEP